MRIHAALVALAIIAPCPALAQAQVPHLTGALTLDPRRGEMDGTLCLERFAPRRKVRFLLGNPLNIGVITDVAGNAIPYDGEYGTRVIGEAREYVIAQPDSLPPLSSFCVRFRGAVPVFDSATAWTDWKGRITSMAGTVRAAEQARWYPTLFDSATTAVEDLVTYDLRVRCSCRSIYVNGAEPVHDSVGHFASGVPRTLLLYAGDFSVQRAPAVTFVQGRANPRTMHLFTDAIARVGRFYEGMLGVAYGDHPVLLSFESISRRYPHGQVTWQFVTWPTIAFSGGLDFDAIVDTTGGTGRIPDWLWGSMSHEMGHYYFGTLRNPHGPLYWFVLESTAEYLALKSTAAMRGEPVFASRLVGYVAAVGGGTYPALSAVATKDDIGQTFRYQLLPLRLQRLAWQVGEDRVARMLRALLTSPAGDAADYAAVTRAATAAGIPTPQLDSAMSAAAPLLREQVLAYAHRVLAARSRTESSPAIVQLAADLITVDTTSDGQRQVMAALTAVLSRDSANLPALYQMGKLGAVGGIGLDSAKRALERYLAVPARPGTPAHADARYRLGMVLERMGDKPGAAAEYTRALALNPQHAAAAQALARLGR
jgi:TolA-binding protein